MDKNKATVLNQCSEQDSRPRKGDGKNVSEVREGNSNNGAKNYSAVSEQQNVKKL